MHPYAEAAISAGFAILVYINTLEAGFVYDDNRAIVTNLDVHSITPIVSLLHNDYWGTPMTHSGSHKSFRPVTTLTFRMNFAISGLKPWSYHMFNVILHAIATWLFVTFIKQRIFCGHKKNFELSLGAGIYFAIHPIHTEAVAGIVGRADILSALFVFATLLCYGYHCDNLDSQHITLNKPDANTSSISLNDSPVRRNDCRDRRNKRKAQKTNLSPRAQKRQASSDGFWKSDCVPNNYNPEPGGGLSSVSKGCAMEGMTIIFGLLASFSKETGFAALPLCIAYDIWWRSNLGIISIFKVLFTKGNFHHRCLRNRIWRLVASTFIIISLRVLPWVLYSQGSATPSFSSSDNPASASESLLTRCLTFHYLIFCNVMLVLFPATLSYDWGGISLIESITDSRNLYTAIFYVLLAVLLYSLWVKLRYRDSILETSTQTMSRERNYHLCRKQNSPQKNITNANINMMTSPNNLKSLLRTDFQADEGVCFHTVEKFLPRDLDNEIHSSDVTLQRLMLEHVQGDAKTNYEKAESTQSSGYATESSEEAYDDDVPASFSYATSRQRPFPVNRRKQNTTFSPNAVNVAIMGFAFAVIPFLPVTNLFFYVGFIIAERILYLPSAGFCILVIYGWQFCVDHLSNKRWKRQFPSISRVSFWLQIIALMLLAIRTTHRNLDWQDQYHLYRSGISTSPAKSWSNLGNVMKESGRIKDAEGCYLNALAARGNMADVHYNLGLLYQEQNRYHEALNRYRLAIRFRKTLAVAYLNSGIVLSELGKVKEAEQMYRLTITIDDIGLRDPASHSKAKISALYNLGRLLSSQRRHNEAIRAFEDAVERLTPDYEPHSLYNMLGQCLHKVGRMPEAEKWFKLSLRSKSDHVPAHLTYALLLRDEDRTLEAKRLYETAIALDPRGHLAFNHYAKLLIREENFAHAARIIEMALVTTSGTSDYDTVMLAGDIFRLLQDDSKAEKYYRTATQILPLVEAGHINLGAVLHLRGKYAEARTCYQKALSLNPGSETAMRNLQRVQNLMD